MSPAERAPRLASGYGQHRHHLDAVAGEDGEVGMILEKLHGSLVRLRAYHGKGAQLIAHVLDAVLAYFFGPAERASHLDDDVVMFLNPVLPAGHALAFFDTPIGFGKCIPGQASCAGLAAEKYCEIRAVRAHGGSFHHRPK